MEFKGPLLYENWRAASAGKPAIRAFEFPLIGDAHLTGDLKFSNKAPYRGFNTVAIRYAGIARPSLIIREDFHISEALASTDVSTDVERYHGGSVEDEFAALVSLCVGARFQAGPISRLFLPDEDARGLPVEIELRQRGGVALISDGPRHQHVLPAFALEKSLSFADERIPLLTKLSPQQATSLIKAARQYQNGVWLSESEPELSWLFLVSAVETAAAFWRKDRESPAERLRASLPKVADILIKQGGEDHLKEVASELVQYLGATKKFQDFLLSFLPAPPDSRPQMYQISWEDKSMKKAFGIIYDWRSRALHAGTPFPYPMCEAPRKFEDGYCERPMGLATTALGGSWTKEDVPMLLHTFEYVVRNALLAWWQSMAGES